MRLWIYETLAASVTIESLVDDRINQSSAFREGTSPPHVIYRLGDSRPLLHSEEIPAIELPFQVFAYDVPGDYTIIEDILAAAKASLTLYPPIVESTKLIRCKWLGDSAEVSEDPATGHISKFSRMTLIHQP